MSQVTWLRNTGENPFKRLLLGPKFRFPYFEFRFNGISFIKLKCFFLGKDGKILDRTLRLAYSIVPLVASR